MGADLILSWVKVPSPCTLGEVDTAIGILLDGLEYSDLKHAFGEDGPWGPAGEEILRDQGDIGDDEWPRLGDLDDVPQAILEGAAMRVAEEELRRAATQIWFGGAARRDTQPVEILCDCGCGHVNKFIFSGDMSWGDCPDAFELMEILSYFDLASLIKSDLQHLADVAKETT